MLVMMLSVSETEAAKCVKKWELTNCKTPFGNNPVTSKTFVEQLMPDADIKVEIEAEKAITQLFEQTNKMLAEMKKLAEDLSMKSITRTEDAAIKVMEEGKKDILQIEAQLNKDIEGLLTQVDERYRGAIRDTFQEINHARAEALIDLRYTIGYVDEQLEERISQVTKSVLGALAKTDEIASNFAPNKFQTDLVAPALNQISQIQKQFFDQVKDLIDYLACEGVSPILSSFDDVLKENIERLPFTKEEVCSRDDCETWWGKPECNPCCWDPTVDLWDEHKKEAQPRTDMKLYRYYICSLESELKEDSRIQRITDNYIELLEFTKKVYCESRSSEKKPYIQKEAIKLRDKYNLWVRFKP